MPVLDPAIVRPRPPRPELALVLACLVPLAACAWLVVRASQVGASRVAALDAAILALGAGTLLASGLVLLSRDRTEKKRNEELTMRLSSAVEQTADSVVITDRCGVIEYVNPAFEQTTGYSRAEAIGFTPRILRSGEQTAAFYESMWATILGGEAFKGTVVNRKKGGELFVAEQTITPMRDRRTGELTHFVSVLRDLTDRLELEEHAIEQRLAGSVQQRLFPRTPARPGGLDLAGAFAPAQDTFGDYYDFLLLPDGKLMFVVADVCGHGMGAALIMVETRAYLRSLALAGLSIEAIVEELNRLLLEDLEANRFVTMVLGILDPVTGALRWASMGHPRGVVLDAGGAVRATLDSTCKPLGLFPGIGSPLGEPTDLQDGDLLLLLTDGVLESATPEGAEFGLDGVLEVVRANLHAPAEAVARRVVDAALAHAGGKRQVDDVTAVIIRRTRRGLFRLPDERRPEGRAFARGTVRR